MKLHSIEYTVHWTEMWFDTMDFFVGWPSSLSVASNPVLTLSIFICHWCLSRIHIFLLYPWFYCTRKFNSCHLRECTPSLWAQQSLWSNGVKSCSCLYIFTYCIIEIIQPNHFLQIGKSKTIHYNGDINSGGTSVFYKDRIREGNY